jgi:hypothetical protein
MPRAPRRRHNASVSRLKALLSLVENFSRLSLLNAGSTSAKWKHVVAGWTTAAGKGTSVALGALISTTFSSTDATIKAKNPASGVGPAFWITDSGNYWSVIHNVINVCQTCTACGSYNSCTYCSSYGSCSASTCNGYGNCPASSCNGGFSNCPSQGCLAFGSCPASICNSWYQSPRSDCNTWTSSPASSCNTWEFSPRSTCSEWTFSPQTGCSSPYFYSVTVCNGYGYTYKGGYACNSWTSSPRTGCNSYYTYYTYTCTGYYNYWTTTCIAYYNYYTTVCSAYYDYFVNVCASYYDYTYTCCTGGYYTYYYTCCPGGYYDYTYTCCTGGYYDYTVSCCTGYSSGVSSACGCASYYDYSCNCVDNHRIDLSKKENGSETLISSTSNSTTNIAGIKVVTSGDTITASAYSDVNFSSQIGSSISTTNTGQKSKDHGIISKASSSSQGYTIDEFRVNND